MTMVLLGIALFLLVGEPGLAMILTVLGLLLSL